mgnify:FL=1
MSDGQPYQLLADAVLALHVAIVAFVVGGLLLVVIGNLRNWSTKVVSLALLFETKTVSRGSGCAITHPA